MWGFKKNKLNAQHQSNKARGGAVKSSTIEVNGGGNDATNAMLFKSILEMMSLINKNNEDLNKRINSIEKRQKHTYTKTQKISKALEHYVANNGVPQEVKDEVKRILK